MATVALSLLVVGCAPPEPPLEVGVKEISTDVIIGTRDAPPDPAADAAGTTPTSSGADPLP